MALPARFLDKVKKTPTCWLWQAAKGRGGYGRYQVNATTTKYAHRFAYEKTTGEIPHGIFVLHRCDVPGCVRPDHLFLGTAKDNTADMFAKGRANKANGERHAGAKLTASQVIEIRRRAADGEKQRDIALDFKVSEKRISKIILRQQWKHIP